MSYDNTGYGKEGYGQPTAPPQSPPTFQPPPPPPAYSAGPDYGAQPGPAYGVQPVPQSQPQQTAIIIQQPQVSVLYYIS